MNYINKYFLNEQSKKSQIRVFFEAVLSEVQARGTYSGGRSGTARPSSKTPSSESAPEARPGEKVIRATGDGTSKEDAALQRKTNTAQDAMDAATTPSESEGKPPANLPEPKDKGPYVPMAQRKAETPGGKPTNPDNSDNRKIGTSKYALTHKQARDMLMAMRNKS